MDEGAEKNAMDRPSETNSKGIPFKLSGTGRTPKNEDICTAIIGRDRAKQEDIQTRRTGSRADSGTGTNGASEKVNQSGRLCAGDGIPETQWRRHS